MQKISFNHLIETIMFLYILSLYLLTYREDLNLISNAVALLLTFTIWINFILTKRKLVFNKLLFLYAVFLIICMISVYFAIDQDTAVTKVKTLLMIFILMVSLINYVDTFEKLRKTMIYFVYSGVIASIYILFTTDFSQMSRLGGEIGNENTVGVIIGISAIFCFYFLVEEKKYILFFPILMMYLVILLTGSRSALLFSFINLLLFLFLKNRNGLINKFKLIATSIISILVVSFLIFNVPILYQIIGIRIESMITIINGGNSNEGSINSRGYMVEAGIEMFKQRPISGYGIGNYGVVFSTYLGGWNTYAHNNIIELLVGIGILGVIVYYFAQIIIIKDLVKASRYSSHRKVTFIFISLITSYILLSVSSVYYYSKHFNIILVIASIVGIINKKDKIKIKQNHTKL